MHFHAPEHVQDVQIPLQVDLHRFEGLGVLDVPGGAATAPEHCVVELGPVQTAGNGYLLF